ncbi:MAG: HD domain-containing protein [Thermodesulfovibrionales bacterium]|nr:HD domain-containing protein [Thermodesulfovibrionales bacterium]
MPEPLKIIKKYYNPDSLVFRILIEHGEAVKKKALQIAGGLKDRNPDIDFIIEAAMLHDIGIILTNSPLLGCYGKAPYIAHGYLGRQLLESEGLYMHGLVAERHVGAGITIKDIKEKGLPLPVRNMVPESLEEKIICVADKFFSKNRNIHTEEKSLDIVLKEIAGYGEERLSFFEKLLRELRLMD